MTDFEEIALTGGKIEFLKGEGGVSLQYSHAEKCANALYQIGWVPDGDSIRIVGNMSFGGLDQRPGAQTMQSGPMPAWIVSDREGFFGRMCPGCKTYFRTTRLGSLCPYCHYEDDPLRFQTAKSIKVY